MAYYEFEGCDNPKCPDKKRERKFVPVTNIYVIKYALGKAPGVGERVPCPRCGTGHIIRVFSSSIGAIIRGTQTPTLGAANESFMTRIEGQDTMVTFVDHPHTDPAYQTALSQTAKQHGISGLGKAYYNEKHGRICVDVAANVPDPLGKMKREAARRGAQETTKVNQPVAVRPKSGSRTPRQPKHQYGIPVRRVA